MSYFQILSVGFAIFMLYVVKIHRQKSKLSMSEFYFWSLIWIIFIIVAIFPNLLLGISKEFNFDRTFDLLIVGAFMILTFVTMRSYFKYREIDDKLEKVIRKLSINDSKKIRNL